VRRHKRCFGQFGPTTEAFGKQLTNLEFRYEDHHVPVKKTSGMHACSIDRFHGKRGHDFLPHDECPWNPPTEFMDLDHEIPYTKRTPNDASPIQLIFPLRHASGSRNVIFFSPWSHCVHLGDCTLATVVAASSISQAKRAPPKRRRPAPVFYLFELLNKAN
jgi:hypothetical protein